MNELDKWRREASRKLQAQVERKRDLNTVTGRVEDRFDEIRAARRRGMSWKQIALAIADGEPVSVAAIESAWKRIAASPSAAFNQAADGAGAFQQHFSPDGRQLTLAFQKRRTIVL